MRTFGLLLIVSSCALAQTNPLTQAVTTRYNSAKQNLLGAAEAMPEENYAYKLSPEQRPFGLWIEHTALGNYMFCAGIKGSAAPDMSKVHGLTSKAELQKALKDSFDYCDGALAAMDDKKALTEAGRKYPVNGMVSLIASLNEHYGNLVGYLRTKGITPPSTARAKK
ncbi:MAG: DinB family protein [Bryobacteraceae bacterium]